MTVHYSDVDQILRSVHGGINACLMLKISLMKHVTKSGLMSYKTDECRSIANEWRSIIDSHINNG